MTIHPCPKPEPKAKAKRYSSLTPPSHPEMLERARKQKRTRVVAINRKRKAKNHVRAYGAHAAFIRSRPCCCCGVIGYTVAAHTKNGGIGYKSHRKHNVPLCCSRFDVEGCHERSGRIGVETFQRIHNIDLRAIAAEYWLASPEHEKEGA